MQPTSIPFGENAAAPRIALFDLGEVLVSAPNLLPQLAARIGCEVGALSAGYWRYRDEYDRDGDARSFWDRVLQDAAVSASADLVTELSDIDTREWTTIRPEAATILAELAAAGVRIGILSNAPTAIARLAREQFWAKDVTDWFFSAELETAKPDAAIYRHVTDAVDLVPGSIAFIDDRIANVTAARRAGWNAQLWQSDADTRAWLKRLGLL